MQANTTRWRLLITAVIFGLSATVSAWDDVAGETAKGRSSGDKSPSGQDAHGLLAKRVVQLAPDMPGEKKSSALFPDIEPPPLERPIYVRTAAWTTPGLLAAEYTESVNSPPESTISGMESCTSGFDADCDCCSDPLWCHRSGVFADLLYLRAGNIDYVYAVEQTGPSPDDSPTGPTGRVGFDGALGYRFGATCCLSDCSSIQVSYTWFQDATQNTINAVAPNVLIFQPGDPSIPNAAQTSIQASANYDIRFQQLDLDYRGLLYGTCNSSLNYFGGVRYTNLKQDFRAQEDVGAPFGITNAVTHINFDGFGIGTGLEGIRRSATCGLLVYGRGSASFVAGEFKATYRQFSQFGPNSIVGNNLTDFRVVTILQTELGLGWQNCTGNLRLTAGYQFAGWFNSLTTGTYIHGVQNRRFDNLGETIAFDGLVTRLMWQF